MADSRKVIRRVAAVATAVVLTIAVYPVAGEFFVELAREKGLYDQPSQRISAVSTLIAEVASSFWFQWIGAAILGFTAGVWIDAILKRKSAAVGAGGSVPDEGNGKTSEAVEWRQEGLYIEHMTVIADKLASDLYISLGVYGFNATGSSITISVHGCIRFSKELGASQAVLETLRAPRLCPEKMKAGDVIANLRPISLVLEQHMSREVADSFLRSLDAGNAVFLDLKSLELLAQSVEQPNQRARLPLWAGVSVARAADRLVTGKIAASGHVVLNAGINPSAAVPDSPSP